MGFRLSKEQLTSNLDLGHEAEVIFGQVEQITRLNKLPGKDLVNTKAIKWVYVLMWLSQAGGHPQMTKSSCTDTWTVKHQVVLLGVYVLVLASDNAFPFAFPLVYNGTFSK